MIEVLQGVARDHARAVAAVISVWAVGNERIVGIGPMQAVWAGYFVVVNTTDDEGMAWLGEDGLIYGCQVILRNTGKIRAL